MRQRIKTITGTLAVMVEKIGGDTAEVKVYLFNRKGEAMWATKQTLTVGESLNLMGATFKLTIKED